MSNIAPSGTLINLWGIVCENRSIFKVTIGTGNDLIDLRKVIKGEKQNYFANVDADELVLWRVNVASNELRNKETAIEPYLNEKLEDPADTVGNTFQNVIGNNIRVIVDVPVTERPVVGQVRARSPSLTVEDIDERKRLKREQEYKDTVSRGLRVDSPSGGSKHKVFFRNQESHPIFNGRPFENSGPPIILYSDVFVKFLDDFNNANQVIPSDFLQWTEQLIITATNNYTDEEARNTKIRELFSSKLGTVLIVEYGEGRQKPKSDGAFTSTRTGGLLTAYTGIFEGKNEIGEGGSDPTIQGALYYRDYWSQSNVDQIRECCCAPSFIIAMAGPWFCILGAVFLNRVVIQPLTDFIPLTVNLRIPEQLKRIAHFFYALKNSLHQLHLFYHHLDLNSRSDQRFFPYIRQFGTTTFTYISELVDDPTRAIWKAKTNDDHMIVVKFVSKYSAFAHRCCQYGGYAPELLYNSDDNETRFGGLKMIVMEYVNGTSLDQILKDGTINTLSCQAILDDVTAAIELLHNYETVFADLRAPNIMIVDTDTGKHAKLIDFDWCGRDEIDRYPPSMNSKLPWPPGADPGELLRKEHDIYWLDKLRESLKINPIVSLCIKF